ncbi:hypothetical protein ACLB2K_019649 [Fragaria x ananassa]
MTELPPDPIDLPHLQQSLSLISLISRSHHTSLIKLLGASLSGSYVYLVYEFVGGKNISQDILEQLTPMIILHFGGNILSRIGTLFDKYMDALLNAVPLAKTGKSANETSKDDNTKSGRPKKSKSASNADKSASVNGEVSVSNQRNQRLTPAELQRQKIASLQKKLLDELNEEGDGHAAPVVKLGDASMASPFTVKHASVAPTTDIIRQGRSTLVTTLQMFKILGLNCLATAYVLSVMYLDGVKLGDMQATISGVFTAAFFLFISHARPLQTLSSERPHPNIFCAYVFLSLLGQASQRTNRASQSSPPSSPAFRSQVGGGGVRRWVDRRLKDSFPMEVAEKMVQVALECVEDEEDGWVEKKSFMSSISNSHDPHVFINNGAVTENDDRYDVGTKIQVQVSL